VGTKAATFVLLLLLLLGLLHLILVLEQHVTGFKGFMVKLYCFSFFWRGALLPPTRVLITQFGQLEFTLVRVKHQ
jgi:hypothetical protein